MKDLKEFIEENKIKMCCEMVDENPHMQDQDWKANHYKVTLKHQGRQFTMYYSMGLGLKGEPKIDDVLDCCAMDSAGIENARSFEDWANEYGYDPDSRKAEKTYNTCEKQANKLKNLLDYELYEQLLWEVERQ